MIIHWSRTSCKGRLNLMDNEWEFEITWILFSLTGECQLCGQDNPVVRWRKAGLVRRITRQNPALILFMANLVRLCRAHNDEPLLILQTAQLHLDTSRNQFIPMAGVSVWRSPNVILMERGDKLLQAQAQWSHWASCLDAWPCRPSQGEPQDMIYISTGSHAGDPRGEVGTSWDYYHRFPHHLT